MAKKTRAKAKRASGKKKVKRLKAEVEYTRQLKRAREKSAAAAMDKVRAMPADGKVKRAGNRVPAMMRAAAGGGGGGAAVAVDPAVAELVKAAPIREISIAAIEDKTLGGRNAGGEAAHLVEAGLKELASSIRRSGVLQPIGVLDVGGGKYEQIWGSRRRRGCLEAGLKTIPAKVFKDLTPEVVQQLRAVENLQRRDWNLVEEGMHVARMLAERGIDAPGESLTQRCKHVAALLGKSESWVLDRSYLARLDGQARDLVACGRLPLQQARAIATLADPVLQNDVADMAALRPDGSGGMSYESVQKYCAEHRRSLKTVPWKLDVKVGAKPACATCPANTANDSNLFGHDLKESKAVAEAGPFCVNESCFEHKRDAIERKLAAGTEKVVEFTKKNKGAAAIAINATALEAAGLMPVEIKPATFVRKAKQAVEGPVKASGKPKAGDTPGGGPKTKQTAEEKAKLEGQFELERAQELWFNAAADSIAGGVKTPAQRLYLSLLSHSPLWRLATDDSKKEKRATTLALPKFATLISRLAAPTFEHILELVPDEVNEYGLTGGYYAQQEGETAISTMLAKALGVELPAFPKTIEDVAKSKAAKAAAK